VEQLGAAPDRIFVPTGSGDGIYGIWKGFRELAALGAIPRAPRMVACQSTGADSTVRAFQAGRPRHEPLEHPATVALTIGERIAGDHALRAVYDSGGEAIAVSDEQILDAARRLARQGLALENASAAALACAETLPRADGEKWVVIGSGAAVKWPLS
jgi:threonine synthase